jgi:hypothetical protein
MVNKVRGEAALEVPNIGTVTLCLSLGAMATLEGAFGLEDFSQIGEKLKKPKGDDVATLVAALAAGPTGESYSAEDVKGWRVGLPTIMVAIKDAMATGEDAGGN